MSEEIFQVGQNYNEVQNISYEKKKKRYGKKFPSSPDESTTLISGHKLIFPCIYCVGGLCIWTYNHFFHEKSIQT